MNTCLLLFSLSLLIILYAYAGYPVVLYLMSRLKNRAVRKGTITPTVSLIIAAYNEEHGIEDKIKNSLGLVYPPSALEIIVASDGSTDRTNSMVEGYASYGVKLLTLPRRGKIFALDEAVARSKGEILVFSDANTFYHPTALCELVSNFADPQVGGVCGNQMHYKEKKSDAAKWESIYWQYDKWVKKMESRTGSIVSADGAIYAIRRHLYKMPDSTTSTDDFAISTEVIEKGYRLVFESRSLVYEYLSANADIEFKRKVRIITRGLRGVLLRKRLLNPLQYGFYSIILFSHKVLRRLISIFLLILLLTSIFLSSQGTFFFSIWIAQLLFYLMAAVGFFLRRNSFGGLKAFAIPFFFCLTNIAAMVAVFNFITGRQIQRWEPRRASR